MIALLESKLAGVLTWSSFFKNAVAGVMVGLVALPLAMAFAIASGAKPEQGLYTAIVAGFIVAVFGGSRVQIAGPTGAFVVVLLGISARYGMDGLQIATLLAGIILMALGLFKVGGWIKYIPDPVIIGFTAGIAVIILVGQIPYFLGLRLEAEGHHFHQKLEAIAAAVPQTDGPTVMFGVGALAAILLLSRLSVRMPAYLVVLAGATAVQAFFEFPSVATIGTAFGGIPGSLPPFHLPEITVTKVVRLIGPAFTIAFLGAIESLLSAVVADGMLGTRHRANQELIGQGLANIAAPFFGGFAATGAIARTATNIRSGGTTPVAGIVHSLTLVVIILVFAPLAAHVPLAVLAAILFMVAYHMSEYAVFADVIRRAPRYDAAILLTTFFLTIFADLTVAVSVGVIMAALAFMHRVAQSVRVWKEDGDHLSKEGACQPIPDGVSVYSIEGPFFFGAIETFESVMASASETPREMVFRLGRVPFIDATGLFTLKEILDMLRKRGIQVVLCEASPQVAAKLQKAGIRDSLGTEGFSRQLSDAILDAYGVD